MGGEMGLEGASGDGMESNTAPTRTATVAAATAFTATSVSSTAFTGAIITHCYHHLRHHRHLRCGHHLRHGARRREEMHGLWGSHHLRPII